MQEITSVSFILKLFEAIKDRFNYLNARNLSESMMILQFQKIKKLFANIKLLYRDLIDKKIRKFVKYIFNIHLNEFKTIVDKFIQS